MTGLFDVSRNPWLSSYCAIAVVSGLPLIVTFVLARQGTTLAKWLPHLTALGAGAVFGAAVAHLIPEALGRGQSVAQVTMGTLVGFAIFALVERLLAGHDHAHAHGVPLGAPSAHHSDSSEADCVHLQPTPQHSPSVKSAKALAPLALAGDAIHNFVDGSLIAAGFLANPSVGLLTLLAVGLHELPREMGTFGLFVHGGIRPMRAVAYNALTAVLALVGATVTLMAGTRWSSAVALLLPVAAGTYLYIAFIVGRASVHDGQGDHSHWARLAWSAGGVALMLMI